MKPSFFLLSIIIAIILIHPTVYTADFEVQYPSGRKIVCFNAWKTCQDNKNFSQLFQTDCGIIDDDYSKKPVSRIVVFENTTCHNFRASKVAELDFGTPVLVKNIYAWGDNEVVWPVTVRLTDGDSLCAYSGNVSFLAEDKKGNEIKIEHIASFVAAQYPEKIIVNPKITDEKR